MDKGGGGLCRNHSLEVRAMDKLRVELRVGVGFCGMPAQGRVYSMPGGVYARGMPAQGRALCFSAV